jgi:hypothetical protein
LACVPVLVEHGTVDQSTATQQRSTNSQHTASGADCPLTTAVATSLVLG